MLGVHPIRRLFQYMEDDLRNDHMRSANLHGNGYVCFSKKKVRAIQRTIPATRFEVDTHSASVVILSKA